MAIHMLAIGVVLFLMSAAENIAANASAIASHLYASLVTITPRPSSMLLLGGGLLLLGAFLRRRQRQARGLGRGGVRESLSHGDAQGINFRFWELSLGSDRRSELDE